MRFSRWFALSCPIVLIASLAFAEVRNEVRPNSTARSCPPEIACAGDEFLNSAALFQALRADDFTAVKRLLDAGRQLAGARHSNGATALMHAGLYAGPDSVKLLLDRGADPNARNPAGATALMWAVHNPAAVKLLLDRGADPNARSQEGRTPLLIAARRQGSLPVIQMLLKRGADPNASDSLGGTALMLAAQAGDPDTVRLLIEKGADVNARAWPAFGLPRFGPMPPGLDQPPKPGAPAGLTPLMSAVIGGSRECVRILLEKGADPSVSTVMGLTALIYGVFQTDPAIVEMLLEKGANVNAAEFRGATALILAAATDDATPGLVSLLVSKGADLKARDKSGQTALAWALKRGDTEIARALRQAGAPE